MEVIELELKTGCLLEMKEFYVNTLGFSLLEETETAFAVKAGTTTLRFSVDPGKPFYHFAFNIPENKIGQAREWLQQRVKLLQEEGEELVHFPHWNAHSLYFLDPAGNIVELIARHNLSNRGTGAFTPADILRVSEIGLPVDDVMQTIDDLQLALNIGAWREPSRQFAPLGSEDGMFIIVQKGRIWFMTDKPAEAFPLRVKIKGKRNVRTCMKSYAIEVQKG
ncbi:VOC family protein [Brevibacillus sp. H7]|uniref:VOC family protein n=1 Tax=Brevibacillus sp. H7 TaxID=3349138 RepID=UPI003806B1EA